MRTQGGTPVAGLEKLPDLLVLRHGETEWNRAGRLQGDRDSPLTSAGREQARMQGVILRSLNAGGWHWYVSPQGRAMATAQLAGAPEGGRLIADARLREIGLGDWAGRLREDLAQEAPEAFAGPPLDWYNHAPRGEGVAGLAARLVPFLAGLNGPSVIVTHGITSRVLRCLATGRDVAEFGAVEGGQGVVYRISEGRSARITRPVSDPPD